jgi:hypothetical protein
LLRRGSTQLSEDFDIPRVGSESEASPLDIVIFGVKQTFKIKKKQTVFRSTVGKCRNRIVISASKNAVVAVPFIVVADIAREHNISSGDEVDGF